MLVKVVDIVIIITPSTLAVALTRVTPHKELGFWEISDSGDIVMPDCALCSGYRLVQFTGGFVSVIGPDSANPCFTQTKVAATATRKKGYGVTNFLARC